MIEAAMIWNEPNNKSHWDPALDPDWTKFGAMAIAAADAIKAVEQYRFGPATENGKPVPVEVNIDVQFRVYDHPPTP